MPAIIRLGLICGHLVRIRPEDQTMWTLLLLLLSLSHSHTGVVILKDGDGGPLQAELGQDLSLLCNYQVMGDSLYSIKWYRDDREFFRYIPTGYDHDALHNR